MLRYYPLLLFVLMLIVLAPLRAQTPPADRDSYGGWATGPTLTSSGYFRTENYQGQRWLVDPLGHLYFAAAMGRIYMTAAQSPEAYGRVQSWNFNAASLPHYNTALPYMQYRFIVGGLYSAPVFNLVNTGSGYGGMPDVYDPNWQAALNAYLVPLCKQSKSDPLLIGYYIDNELGWLGALSRTDSLGRSVCQQASTPIKLHFMAQMQIKYGTIDAFNSAWGTSLASWDAANAAFTLNLPLTASAETDCVALLSEYSGLYFSAIASVLHTNDPNHLYLGCRFSHFSTETATAAAASCDVVSFDIYDPTIDPTKFALLDTLGKPVIISEMGNALSDPLFRSNQWTYTTDDLRGQQYAADLNSVLARPSIIGMTWYEYQDDPYATNQSPALNQNARWGFVDQNNTSYPTLTSYATSANASIYAVRGAGAGAPITVSPASVSAGAPGVTLTITGTGFTAATKVIFGTDTKLTANAASSTTLTVDVPAADIATIMATTVNVVSTSAGGGSSVASFSVTVPSATPKITSLSPASVTVGASGFTLTIKGSGFDAATVVGFGSDTPIKPTLVSSSIITAAVPAADVAIAGQVTVTVTNPLPAGSAATAFTVNTPIQAVLLSGSRFSLVNRTSGMALEDYRGGTRSGTLVVQNPAVAGSDIQQWSIVQGSSGFYVLKNRHSNLALDDYNFSMQPGARADQASVDGSDKEEWQIVDAGGGYFTLINRHNSLVLEDYNSSTAASAAVDQGTANGSSSQQWRIAPAN